MSADAVLSTLSQAGFGLQQFGKALLTVFLFPMQIDGSPRTIFAVEQLLWAFQFIVVVLRTAAIRATPILDDVPIGPLATVTGCDGTLVLACWVKTADDC